MLRTLLLTLTLLAFAGCATPLPRVVEARWITQSGDSPPLEHTLGSARRPTLILQARLDDGRCVSGAPDLGWDDQPCEPPSAGTSRIALWEHIPRPLDYDNTRACPANTPDCNAIQYDAQVLYETGDEGHGWRIPLDVLYRTPGSHLLTASVLDTAGPIPSQATVVIANDASYVGRASELIGAPFVYFPGEREGRHQTDARLGADCVAVVIYGRRRLGETVRYMSPSALAQLLQPVTGEVRRGDVLHFGFQTALLAEDTPPLGVLDESDIILHSYHGRVEHARFDTLPYRANAMRLLRWP